MWGPGRVFKQKNGQKSRDTFPLTGGRMSQKRLFWCISAAYCVEGIMSKNIYTVQLMQIAASTHSNFPTQETRGRFCG